MKIFNYLNLVGKEITTKEMELVRGGTSDSGGTCRANGCGANEKVMGKFSIEVQKFEGFQAL